MDTNKRLFHLPKQLVIKAKDFADELTGHNIIERNLSTPAQQLKERGENRKVVRSVLLKRGVRPLATGNS
jgi:DNA-damage-inducible protein D